MSASLGSTQLHAMPPLMPSYISGSGHLLNPVPINHNSLVRGSLSSGQHAFQTHIPVNIGGTATIAPPRGSVTMPQRSALPTLKPTNISNQVCALCDIFFKTTNKYLRAHSILVLQILIFMSTKKCYPKGTRLICY